MALNENFLSRIPKPWLVSSRAIKKTVWSNTFPKTSYLHTGEHPFNITIDNQIETTSHLKLEWSYNHQITEIENPENGKIKFKEFQLQNALADYQRSMSDFHALLSRKDTIQVLITNSRSDYTKEELMHDLEEVEKEIKKSKPDNSKIVTLRKEIQFLKKTNVNNLSFPGITTRILLSKRTQVVIINYFENLMQPELAG